MSVAFTREESAETAAEVELPDRPISPHPNLVTASGLEALTDAMSQSRTAYEAAQQIQDATTFGGGSSTSAAVSALSSRVKATLTVTTFPSQGYRSRCRGRLSGYQIFRRTSQDSSARYAACGFQRGCLRASGDFQARRRQAPGLQDRRGRRGGSSEWINIVRLSRRAGFDWQGRG